MLGILSLNVLLIVLFYKELKLSTFDPALAMTLGFNPVLIHYGLIAMTSVTAVGAFDSVGSILVIGFMIAPPVTAYLLVDSLGLMIGLSVGIGILGAILGFVMAMLVDADIQEKATRVAAFCDRTITQRYGYWNMRTGKFLCIYLTQSTPSEVNV